MVDEPVDRESSVRPWTFKGIPDEIRNAVIAAAERENQSLGEWASRAFLAKIQLDRDRGRLPVVVPANGALVDQTASEVDHPTVQVDRPTVQVDRKATAISDLSVLADLALRLSVEDAKQTDVLKAARRAVIARLEQS